MFDKLWNFKHTIFVFACVYILLILERVVNPIFIIASFINFFNGKLTKPIVRGLNIFGININAKNIGSEIKIVLLGLSLGFAIVIRITIIIMKWIGLRLGRRTQKYS
jgi:hypothetical protein